MVMALWQSVVLEFLVWAFVRMGLEFVGLGSLLVVWLGPVMGLGSIVVMGRSWLGSGLGWSCMGTRLGTCSGLAPDNAIRIIETSQLCRQWRCYRSSPGFGLRSVFDITSRKYGAWPLRFIDHGQ